MVDLFRCFKLDLAVNPHTADIWVSVEVNGTLCNAAQFLDVLGRSVRGAFLYAADSVCQLNASSTATPVEGVYITSNDPSGRRYFIDKLEKINNASLSVPCSVARYLPEEAGSPDVASLVAAACIILFLSASAVYCCYKQKRQERDEQSADLRAATA